MIDCEGLYKRAIIQWGASAQWMMLIEECSELVDAVSKASRCRATREDIITELVDVYIMIEQAQVMLNCSSQEFNEEVVRKLERLEERLNEYAKVDTPENVAFDRNYIPKVKMG